MSPEADLPDRLVCEHRGNGSGDGRHEGPAVATGLEAEPEVPA